MTVPSFRAPSLRRSGPLPPAPRSRSQALHGVVVLLLGALWSACGDDPVQVTSPRVIGIYIGSPELRDRCDVFPRPWLSDDDRSALSTQALCLRPDVDAGWPAPPIVDAGVPIPPATGIIEIVFDQTLRGDLLVDVEDLDGSWRQQPRLGDGGDLLLPVVVLVDGAPLPLDYVVTYNAGGLVDPDSGASVVGLGPALVVAGRDGPLSLPGDAEITIHIDPELVVSARSPSAHYDGPDFTFRTAAAVTVHPADAGPD